MTDVLAIIGALASGWMAFHILKIVYDMAVSFFENRASLKEENRRLRLQVFEHQQGIRRLQEELRKTMEGK